MTHDDWFQNLTAGDSINAAAKRAVLEQGTLNRQLKRGMIPAESVIALARAYGVNPVQALVDTGYLTKDEATGEVHVINWSELPDTDLLRELLRRAEDGSRILEPLNEETVEMIVSTPPSGIPLRVVETFDVAAKAPGYRANLEEDQ